MTSPQPLLAFDPEDIGLYNLQCQRVLGIPGWRWYRLESIHGGTLLTGAVCTAVYQRGPRKGRPNWSKRDRITERRVVLSDAVRAVFLSDWERETGLCCECLGSRQTPWRSSAAGTEYRPCRRCLGSGTRPGAGIAEAAR